jgi:cytochrome c2
MTGAAVPAVEAQSESSSNESSLSQVEYGRQLFVAKGCITCHRNSRVENSSEYWTIEFTGATDLSKFSASPEVLFIRLKDPSSAKSDTQMPNLGLKKDEIEALIAFINSK